MAERLSQNEQSEPGENRRFAGLVNLLFLGMINRFHFNYKRYREDAPPVTRQQVLRMCKDISYKLFAYRNALLTPEPAQENEQDTDIYGATLLVLAKQIFDLMYQMHHSLLELPVEEIAQTIPSVDKLLARWDERQEDPFESVEHDIELMNNIMHQLG